MKNRRITIVAFLLLAALTLGIGYAALTDTLTITGSANIDATQTSTIFDSDIYFSNVVANSERVTANITGTDKDSAEMIVKDGILAEVGNEVIATFTIKSESDLDVEVTPTISFGEGADTTHFAVVTSWNGPQQLKAGQTIDITVSVKVIKTAETNVGTNFTITLKADSQ